MYHPLCFKLKSGLEQKEHIHLAFLPNATLSYRFTLSPWRSGVQCGTIVCTDFTLFFPVASKFWPFLLFRVLRKRLGLR